jgi:hypothetical protein
MNWETNNQKQWVRKEDGNKSQIELENSLPDGTRVLTKRMRRRGKCIEFGRAKQDKTA